MSKVQQAVALKDEGFSCSQALLATYGVDFGLDYETALKMSQAFGGGMGRMAETCGAVTGALMVIGLKYGRTAADDKLAQEKTYKLVRKFVRRFKARNKTIVCRELLGCDISTPWGVLVAKKKGLLDTLCSQFVRDAAEILEEML